MWTGTVLKRGSLTGEHILPVMVDPRCAVLPQISWKPMIQTHETFTEVVIGCHISHPRPDLHDRPSLFNPLAADLALQSKGVTEISFLNHFAVTTSLNSTVRLQ